MADAIRLNYIGFEDNVFSEVLDPKGATPDSVLDLSNIFLSQWNNKDSAGAPASFFNVVVDDAAPEKILSLAFAYVMQVPAPGAADPFANITPPRDANQEAFRKIVIEQSIPSRIRLMQEKGIERYLLLHLLVTEKEARSKGAGTLLLHWLQAKATELELPVYIEATPQGAGLYKKLGWRAVSQCSYDLSPWKPELKEPVVHMEMLWWPKSLKQPD